jgi:hypothetical protein
MAGRSRIFQSSSAEAATGKAFTPPLCKISVSDGPDAGIIYQAFGNNEELCRSLFISLLVILLEWHTALHLTQMCAACSIALVRYRTTRTLTPGMEHGIRLVNCSIGHQS